MPGAGNPRCFREAFVGLVVAVDDRHASSSKPPKISALASAIASSESKYSSAPARRGHDRDMRLHLLDQRGDFAGVIHADFENAETRRRRHPRERQRHAH